MTVVNPPPIVPNADRPPEDDFDGLLRSFFKAEMPNPWPAFVAPASRKDVLPLRRPEAAPRWSQQRSRLALAASVLLLIGGTVLLFGGGSNRNQDQSPQLNSSLLTGQKTKLPDPHIKVTPEGASLEIDFLPMK